MIVYAAVITNAAMWASIVGFLSPLVIQFITNALPGKRREQAVVGFVFSLLIAIPTEYFAGNLTWRDWVRSSMIVFIAAMVSYESLWKPTGVTPSTTGNP
jgi:hypothetical protein